MWTRLAVLIGLMVLSMDVATAAVTATAARGEINLTWTNMATVNCSGNPEAYQIKEYVNGQQQRTWSITQPTIQRKLIEIPRVVQSDTAFGYVVSYFRCSGSGGAYLIAGSTTNVVRTPPIEDRRVIFIHTDLLGSPAAESNERGESTND